MDRREKEAKNALTGSTMIDPGKLGLVKNKKLYYSYLPPAFQHLQERRRKDIQERWNNRKVRVRLKEATRDSVNKKSNSKSNRRI